MAVSEPWPWLELQLPGVIQGVGYMVAFTCSLPAEAPCLWQKEHVQKCMKWVRNGLSMHVWAGRRT